MNKTNNIHELFGELIVFFHSIEKLPLTIKETIVKKGRDAILIDREVDGSLKIIAEKRINEVKKIYKEKLDVVNLLDMDKKNKEDIAKGINNVILFLGIYNTAIQNVLNSERHSVEQLYKELESKHENYLALNRAIIGHIGMYMHRNAA